MEMTPSRWTYTERYIHEVFGAEDPHLRQLTTEARARGMPDIAVSAEVGRLLSLLTATTRGLVALELGTLAGYSATWIARALAPKGKLITIERNPDYARFAAEHFTRAGLAARIELRTGDALGVLPRLAEELGPGSVDFVFIDAEKTEYPEYWSIVRPLLRPGAVLVADNVIGSSSWWIDQESHPARQGADRLNRAVAADLEIEATIVPLRQGLLIARRRETDRG